ncbi:MAG: Na+/H+ antiporter NhaC family protein [Bacillota bacterium]
MRRAVLVPAAIITTILILFAAGPVLASQQEGPSLDFGILSLLPPLIAITLCIISKEVLASLFLGVWVAGTMLSGWNPVAGFLRGTETIWNQLGDPWAARIVLTSLTMGGLVGIMRVGGGIDAAVQWITKRVRSAKGAMLSTELAGFIVFFEDYVNTLVVGTTMSPITGEYRISKEKLSYIVDSTAAPIACIAGVSSWIAYMTGQIGMQFNDLGISLSAYSAYLQSIPFVLYNILALVLLTYVLLSERDVGPMLRAERRARQTGKLLREGARPLISKESDDLECNKTCPKHLINFVFPLVTLIGLILFLLARTGGWPDVSFSEGIANGSTSKALAWASFASVWITIIFYRLQNLASWNRLFTAYYQGMRSIFYGTLILIFAWGIGASVKEVGTARYIVSVTEGILTPGIIPLITFIAGAIIAFSTGTSYGTMAVLMPIVLPLVYNASVLTGTHPMHFMFATIGAVFAGAVFGDHCSPISDTTIMSSMFSGSDHMDHVNTQIPYALIAAGGAIIGYVGIALGLPVLVCLLLSAIVTVGVFRVLSQPIIE